MGVSDVPSINKDIKSMTSKSNNFKSLPRTEKTVEKEKLNVDWWEPVVGTHKNHYCSSLPQKKEKAEKHVHA